VVNDREICEMHDGLDGCDALVFMLVMSFVMSTRAYKTVLSILF
jgi:hypothetical protein